MRRAVLGRDFFHFFVAFNFLGCLSVPDDDDHERVKDVADVELGLSTPVSSYTRCMAPLSIE
jgi:hypothetical protein